jgi:hypothetical protein
VFDANDLQDESVLQTTTAALNGNNPIMAEFHHLKLDETVKSPFFTAEAQRTQRRILYNQAFVSALSASPR